MANTEPPRQKMTTLAPLSTREPKIRSGTSGRRANRPSISTKIREQGEPERRS